MPVTQFVICLLFQTPLGKYLTVLSIITTSLNREGLGKYARQQFVSKCDEHNPFLVQYYAEYFTDYTWCSSSRDFIKEFVSLRIYIHTYLQVWFRLTFEILLLSLLAEMSCGCQIIPEYLLSTSFHRMKDGRFIWKQFSRDKIFYCEEGDFASDVISFSFRLLYLRIYVLAGSLT